MHLAFLGQGFFIIVQKGKVKSHFDIKKFITDQSVYAFHPRQYFKSLGRNHSGLTKIEIFFPLSTRLALKEYENRESLYPLMPIMTTYT